MISGRLEGKTALVTGGSSGIGLGIAHAFVREGCRVVISGRDEDKLRNASAELASVTRGRDAVAFHACNVAIAEEVKALVEWSTSRLGKIDILVNNAGLNVKRRGLRELSPDDWQRILRANLDGAFFCIQAVLPQMLERRDGVIINIVSTAGKRATPLGGAAYSASKFGMAALSHCLGIEEKDNGIRCSAIFPGEVDTPLLAVRPQPVSEEHRNRMLKAEDVAEAALFVATLPPHVTIPELIIKPAYQPYA